MTNLHYDELKMEEEKSPKSEKGKLEYDQFLQQLIILETALKDGASKKQIRNRLEKLINTDLPLINIVGSIMDPIFEFGTSDGGIFSFVDLAKKVDLSYKKRKPILIKFAKYYFIENPGEPSYFEIETIKDELRKELSMTKKDISTALLQAYDEKF